MSKITVLNEKDDWRDIAGFEGYYEISRNGVIRSKDRFVERGHKCRDKGRIIKINIQKGYYPMVGLSKNGKSHTKLVHRLLAIAFIPNPENKPQVNHKDGNKQNNELSNLEWATEKENIAHSFQTGLQVIPKGKDHPLFGRIPVNAKHCQCTCTGRILTYMQAARELEVQEPAIVRMMNGTRRNWTHFVPY